MRSFFAWSATGAMVLCLSAGLWWQRHSVGVHAQESRESAGRRSSSTSEAWSDLYQEADLAGLESAREALRQALAELTNPYYDEAFSVGRFEVTTVVPNRDGYYALPGLDRGLYRTRFWKGQLQTAYLPEEGHEEAYALRDEISWILHREAELRSFQR